MTGSRIIRDGYQAPTPTMVLGEAEIAQRSATNLADYVNLLPSLAGSSNPRSQTSSVSAGTTGINALNLRSLGGNRTLVLLDGQRVAASTLTGLVDINGFPQALVSRVDVVTGGASAAYGSDAVSGVVNFVLDKKFEGLKGEAQGGVTTYGDNRSYKVSLTAGKSFAGGRGHILLNGERAYEAGVFGVPRSWYSGIKTLFNPNYTATNGQSQLLVRQHVGISTSTPGGIIASGPLKGLYFGPGGSTAQLNFGSLLSDPYFVDGDWQYADFGKTNLLNPRLGRSNIFGRVSYELTDNIEVYGQASYASATSYSPGTVQFNIGNLTIQQDNAFLPTAVSARMAALGLSSVTVGSLNQDLGVFIARSKRQSERYVVGADGAFDLLGTAWKWNAYAQKTINHTNDNVDITIYGNYLNAIDSVRGPNGSIVCRSSLTNPNNGCVPYNVLGTGVASQAARDYVLGNSFLKQRLTQEVAAASLNGEPFSTWAGAVSVATGIEYRREAVSGSNDPLSSQNAYFAGNYKATRGSYDVVEGFFETVIPLAKDESWARALDLNAAVRATNYSTSGFVTTWKAGVTYRPIDDVTFRVTRSRDIRAPNLSELFQAGQTQTGTIADPFRNNTNSSFFQVVSGNLNLKPEKSDSLGLGVVLTPRFLPGFAASADYFDINIKDAIGGVGSFDILDNCFNGNTALCAQVIRNSAGVITQINVLPINLAKQKARGIDFESSYRTDLDNIISGMGGSLTVRGLATRYLKFVTDNGINLPINRVGENNGTNPPKWRYLATITYDNGPVLVNFTGRGLSGGSYDNSYIECTTSCPASTVTHRTIDNNHIAGAFYVDASATYKFVKGLEVFFAVDNIANRDPAQVASPTGLGGAPSGVNPVLYDTLGRTFRVGARFKM